MLLTLSGVSSTVGDWVVVVEGDLTSWRRGLEGEHSVLEILSVEVSGRWPV